MKKLSSLGKVLSKMEQKRVIGGEYDPDAYAFCWITTSCELYIRELKGTYQGECYYQIGGKCFCGVEIDGKTYTTDPATTSMCYR